MPSNAGLAEEQAVGSQASPQVVKCMQREAVTKERQSCMHKEAVNESSN